MQFSSSSLPPYLPAVAAVVVAMWTLFDLRRLNRRFSASQEITVGGWVHRAGDPDDEYSKAFKELRKRLISAVIFALGYTVLIYALNGVPW